MNTVFSLHALASIFFFSMSALGQDPCGQPLPEPVVNPGFESYTTAPVPPNLSEDTVNFDGWTEDGSGGGISGSTTITADSSWSTEGNLSAKLLALAHFGWGHAKISQNLDLAGISLITVDNKFKNKANGYIRVALESGPPSNEILAEWKVPYFGGDGEGVEGEGTISFDVQGLSGSAVLIVEAFSVNPFPEFCWIAVDNIRFFPKGKSNISSTSPDSVSNCGYVSGLQILGSGFLPCTNIWLQKAGQADIPTTSLQVVSDQMLKADFDLLFAKPGVWDIVVSDGASPDFTKKAALLITGSLVDCNRNGFPDNCDTVQGISIDCNENGIPDECDASSITLPDCNHNGISDVCELTSGALADVNQNGIPDPCDIPDTSCVWPQYAWSNTFGNYVGENQEYQHVAVDPNNNVLAVGYGTKDYSGWGYSVVLHELLWKKISPSGQSIGGWSLESAPLTQESEGKAITSDPQGNILITGWFRGSIYGANCVGESENEENSQENWLLGSTPSSGSNSNETTNPCAADSGTMPQAAMIIKAAPDGSTIWVRAFVGNPPYPGYSYGTDIATDADGNVYVVGASGGVDIDPGPEEDFAGHFLTRLNADGTYAWTRSLSSFGLPTAVAVDPEGFVVVIGKTQWPQSTYVAQYRLDGEFRWSKTFDPNFSIADIAIGHGGMIWIASGFLARLDRSGQLLWQSMDYSPTQISVDSHGNFFYLDLDGSFGKLRPDGSAVWELRYEPSQWGQTTALGLAVDREDGVVLGGKFRTKMGTNSPSSPVDLNPLPDQANFFVTDPSLGGFGPPAWDAFATRLYCEFDDCNLNHVEDWLDPDCNGNGHPDDCDIAEGTSVDCNQNGIPEECDLASGLVPDCNHNAIPDTCETCAAEIIIVMDTSGSMADEAEALCDSVQDSLNNLSHLPNVKITVLGIGDPLPPDVGVFPFDCLANSVFGLFGQIAIPGNPGQCGPTFTGNSEDWGSAVAILSQHYPWTTTNKIVVPISDEGPCLGESVDPADQDAIDNAIQLAQANGVLVFPITGSGADSSIQDLADQLAAGTGGKAFHTLNLSAETVVPAALDSIFGAACPQDCNLNGVFDVCEIQSGAAPDCNRNGIPDSCDIKSGVSLDTDHNGTPDECVTPPPPPGPKIRFKIIGAPGPNVPKGQTGTGGASGTSSGSGSTGG